MAALHGMCDLSSPTRVRTRALCVPAMEARHGNHGTTKKVPKRAFLKVRLWRTDAYCSIFRPTKVRAGETKHTCLPKIWNKSPVELPGFQAGSLTPPPPAPPRRMSVSDKLVWFFFFFKLIYEFGAQLWVLAALSAASLFHLGEASFLGPAKRKVDHLPDVMYLGGSYLVARLESKYSPLPTQWFCFLGKQLLWTSQLLTRSRAIANQSSAIIAILV